MADQQTEKDLETTEIEDVGKNMGLEQVLAVQSTPEEERRVLRKLDLV